MAHKLGKFPWSYMYTFLSIFHALVSLMFTLVFTLSPNSLQYDVRWKGGFPAGKSTFRPTVAFWDVLEHIETKISGKGGFPKWWFCAHAQVRVRYTAWHMETEYYILVAWTLDLWVILPYLFHWAIPASYWQGGKEISHIKKSKS